MRHCQLDAFNTIENISPWLMTQSFKKLIWFRFHDLRWRQNRWSRQSVLTWLFYILVSRLKWKFIPHLTSWFATWQEYCVSASSGNLIFGVLGDPVWKPKWKCLMSFSHRYKMKLQAQFPLKFISIESSLAMVFILCNHDPQNNACCPGMAINSLNSSTRIYFFFYWTVMRFKQHNYIWNCRNIIRKKEYDKKQTSNSG